LTEDHMILWLDYSGKIECRQFVEFGRL